VVLGVVLTLGPYLLDQHRKTDEWGLTRTTGWTLAARMATFADCSKFTPPKGTEPMCHDPTPPTERRNAVSYQFDPAVSPAARAFGVPLANYRTTDPGQLKFQADGLELRFALAVLRHQFVTYLGTIADGSLKYINPHWGLPRTLEWPQSVLISQLHNEGTENVSLAEAAIAYHHPLAFHRRSRAPLEGYAKFANLEGAPTVLLVLLALAGGVLARGRQRTVQGLIGLVAFTLMISPVALLFYGARYAAPAYGPLAAASALGVDALIPFVWRLTALAPGVRSLAASAPDGTPGCDVLLSHGLGDASPGVRHVRISRLLRHLDAEL
jgi:hypothetical protein